MKSNFEDLDKNFRPAYSTLQVLKKDYHLSELCQACGIKDFEEWSQAKQLRFRIMLLEELLQHPATEIYNSSMLQYGEPVFVV